MLQLETVYLAMNNLSGTLPIPWGGLSQASHAARKFMLVPLQC